MTNIKRIALLVGLIFYLCGCATLGPSWGLVNNTGYDLTVVQDGHNIAELAPGEAIRVPSVWREVSHVSVMAHRKGVYIGANSYTYGDAPYNWQIDHVFVPQGAR